MYYKKKKSEKKKTIYNEIQKSRFYTETLQSVYFLHHYRFPITIALLIRSCGCL